MKDCLEALWKTFTFSDLLTIIFGLVAFVSAIISFFNNKKAKKSEKSAKQYAELSKEYHISAKTYFDQMNEELDRNKKKRELEDIKEEIYKIVCLKGLVNTTTISKEINLSKEETFKILEELLKVEKRISAGGIVSIENNNVWTKR